MLLANANQREPEYHTWVSLCIAMGVRTYLELGSSYTSLNYLRNRGIPHVMGIDLNGWPAELDAHIHYLSASVADPHSVTIALKVLGGPPDAIFIDADHEDASVRADYAMWSPQARYLVGFHDILMPSVAGFWAEVSRASTSVEIIARDAASANVWQKNGTSDGTLACGGIGVLFK